MEEKTPRFLLICCEGEKTEPQYFDSVIRHRKINQGQARVKVVGDKGQHQVLIDHAVNERGRICDDLELDAEEVEVWAVCDKDRMACTLLELEGYALQRSVNIAFSNPRFEVFLLQHFQKSHTNATGRQLEAMLSKAMQKKGVSGGYKKIDLSWLYPLLDREPLILEAAVKNSHGMSNKDSTPYVTTHILLQRLLDLAP